MKYFTKIFTFLLFSSDILYAEPKVTKEKIQTFIKQLDRMNISMQDVITRCKQLQNRNKDDDVDLDFINNLFQQNNNNIKIYLKNGFRNMP